MKIRTEDIEDFEEVVNSSKLNEHIQLKMKNLCSHYKLGGCHFCGDCGSLVRAAWVKIKDFYTKNKTN